MIKAVFFDFDGVLTPDATGTLSIINHMDKLGYDRLTFEAAYRRHNFDFLYGLKTHQEAWPQICQDYGSDISFDALKDAFHKTPQDPGMFELAYHLKSQGYIIGMITDNKRDRIMDFLTYNDHLALFDRLVISADVGSGKKQEEIFKVSLKDLDPRTCVFIDNSLANLRVPGDLGMHTFFYDHEKRDFKGLVEGLKSLGIKV